MTADDRFGWTPAPTDAGADPRFDDGFFTTQPVAPSPLPQPSAPPTGPPPPPYGGALGASQPHPSSLGPSIPAPQPPAPDRGLPASAIVAIAVGSALVGIGILTAIALPTFFKERAVVESTTVSLPRVIAGLPPTRDPALRSMADGFDAALEDGYDRCHCMDRPQARIYSNESATHVVIVMASRAHSPFGVVARTVAERDAFAGAQNALRSRPDLVMEARSELDPGRLGGSLSCAEISGSVPYRVCVATDAGSFFMFTEVNKAGGLDPDLPRRAREATIQRAG